MRTSASGLSTHAHADATAIAPRTAAASIGAIQRGLLALEQQGAERFIGEPMLNVDDLLQTCGGRGVVNILAADRLLGAPKLYSTVLLWLLSELYERLPEIGDPDKPKLVFFFDEAHLLFADAPKILLDKGVKDIVRISDARMSGTSFGTVVLHVAPESAAGGPLAAVETGDEVELDTAGRTLTLQVSHEEIARRLAARPVAAPHYERGYGWMFLQHVNQADEGCDFDFLRKKFAD